MKKIATLAVMFLFGFAGLFAGNNGNGNKTENGYKFNYILTTGTSAYAALAGASSFTWTTSVANDDEYSTATTIGFNFTYCSTLYTQFQASTNGFIRMGTGLSDATPSDDLSGTLRKIIAPLWDDLAVTSTAADVTYQLSGSAPNRVLTIEWKNVKWNKTASSANAQFQMKLYETSNKIEFNYGTFGTPASAGASIGLTDETAITVAGQATGKYLSVNIGGFSGSQVFHQSMGLPFSGIETAPDANLLLTFTPTTISPIAGGTYTVGAPSSNYKTLSEAAMALNIHGVAGAVIMDLADGTYDDVFHLINISGASSTNTITLRNQNSLATLSPSNGSYTDNTPSYQSGDNIIRFDGTQYVTIDKVNITEGVNTTQKAKYEVGIWIGNSIVNTGSPAAIGSRFNVFSNLAIDMRMKRISNTNNGAVGIRFGTGGTGITDTSAANNYNVIRDFTIKNVYANGIKMYGHSGANPDVGNAFTSSTSSRNAIAEDRSVRYNAGDLRAFEAYAQKNLVFEKTEIIGFQDDGSAAAQKIYGVAINPTGGTDYCSGTLTINDLLIGNFLNSNSNASTTDVYGISINRIADATSIVVKNCELYDLYSNGTAGHARGIQFATGTVSGPTTATILAFNNTVYDLRAPASQATSSSPAVQAISIDGVSSANHALGVKLYNNTILLDNVAPPSISGSDMGHNSSCFWWDNMTNAGSSIDDKNNIFINKMGNSATGAGISRAVLFNTTSNANLLKLVSTSNTNLYYIDNPTNTGASRRLVAYDGTGTDLSTLALLQASSGYAPRDEFSFTTDPTGAFTSGTSPYNLHIVNTNWLTNGQGIPQAEVATDRDGEPRSTALANGGCDIGSDEVVVLSSSASVSVSGTIADGNTTTYTGIDGRKAAEITWHTGTGTLPASVTVTYTPGKPLDAAPATSIYRSFTITETGGVAGWNADVKLYYNPASELKGYTETNMRINKYSSGSWTILGTTINTANHYGSFNTTSFSSFGFDDGVTALPVEISSFIAAACNGKVELQWSTASEKNNYGFDVERKQNGSQWQKAGFVNGKGTTTSAHVYSFADNVPAGKYLYRLKQIDRDGHAAYSGEVEAVMTLSIEDYRLGQNYPNPFNPVTNIRFAVRAPQQVILKVYNIAGQEVATLFNATAEPDRMYEVPFDGTRLASGIYYAVYRSVEGEQIKKMVLMK